MKITEAFCALMTMALLSCCGNGGEGRRVITDSDSSAPSAEDAAFTLAEEAASGVADVTQEAWRRADSILAGLTLEEKVGQCFMPTIFAKDDPLTSRKLGEYIHALHVGGVVLLKGNLRDAAAMASQCSEAQVPLFTAINAEWGLGMRLTDAPRFPRNGRLNPEADERLLFDYGREVAGECRRIGINMILGPVVDVAENPHGVIGSRSFGSDPERVAELGVAYARGVESACVISVAKHFPGHGSPADDSHRSLPVIKKSLHQLDSVDLFPFRTYIDAGLSGVMVGHLVVPAIDPECRPAAVSTVVINKLLRKELGFEGLVLTDALNMEGARGFGAKDAIEAGADIIIGPADTAAEIREVIGAVEGGEIAEREIDDRCRRILFYKMLRELAPVEIPYDAQLSAEMERSAADLRKAL